jgi:trimethylamine--corrinoid protein Co-methyltransferase
MGGIEITSETLALDVIHQVGPGGHFLSSPHTARNFRKAWYPTLLDRRTYQGWLDAGRPSAVDAARQAARQAIASHTPVPLSAATLEVLQAMIAEADARTGQRTKATLPEG